MFSVGTDNYEIAVFTSIIESAEPINMSPERKSGSSILPSIIVSAIISFLIAGTFFFLSGLSCPKIAYIDTGKLLVGFSEADNVERAVKVEDDKWQVSLKALQDSLQAQVDRMSKEYDRATPAVQVVVSTACFLPAINELFFPGDSYLM